MNGKNHIKWGFIGTIIFAVVFQVAFGFQGIKHGAWGIGHGVKD